MRSHIALLALLLSSRRLPVPALAQTPTFNIEGVVTDAQQAVLPGVTVTVRNVATGLSRTVDDGFQRPLRPHQPAARGPVRAAGRAARLRDSGPKQPRVQCRPARRHQPPDAAVDHPGDGDGGRRLAAGPDHLGRGVEDRGPGAVRDPAGEGAQLHAPPHARLQRRRQPSGHQRRQRRRRRGVELRYLRGRDEQPLEVADLAARAAARIRRVRDRDGQGDADHHQPVLGRVRRPRRRRVQHDHQERHEQLQRLGVPDGPARRLGRPPAPRHDQGALQPAAVRRRARRAAGARPGVLLRELRAAA